MGKSFKLKVLVGFDWHALSDLQRERLISLILESPLSGETPNRYGLVKCRQISKNRIFGYFTQEVEVEKHRYTIRKSEEKYLDRPFEDFFFILLLDFGLCLLQSRKISEISMIDIEERFEEVVKSIIEKAEGTFYYFEDYILKREKEEFIKIFNTENIISIKVDSLKGKVIPQEFHIFNPDFDKDRIIRAYLNDDFKNLDELSTSTTSTGGLQQSKLSKVALITGNPKEIGYMGIRNQKITVKDQIGPSIYIDMDVDFPRTEDVSRQIDELSSNLVFSKVKHIQKKLTDNYIIKDHDTK